MAKIETHVYMKELNQYIISLNSIKHTFAILIQYLKQIYKTF